MSSPSIYDISIETFLKTVKRNMDGYGHIHMFWLPIIERRARHHSKPAEDLLLNPIFRWCYLNTRDKLIALEQELSALKEALGCDAFANYQKELMENIVGQPTENRAHNRMLDARAEILGMLHYKNKLNCSIVLEPKQPKRETHDFNVYSDDSNIAVEAKFIRQPDKLGEYLGRWWQAQEETSGTRPIGYSSNRYIKFKWQYKNRDELSLSEICEMKNFFRSIFEEPKSCSELSLKRIKITYSPDNKLKPATVPIGAIEENAKHPVDLLMKKIKRVIEKAQDQLSGAKQNGMQTAYYCLLNRDEFVAFHWGDKLNYEIETLKNEYKEKGLDIIIENVGYL